jgi:methylated-DNA-[protein]-cysteine S-methyltransferase
MKIKKTKIEREPTEFALRVYDLLRQVPRGRVVSYGELARALGKASPRAVGQALRRNPYAPEVPCHRVIAANGRIGGFQGYRTGPALRRKLDLLAREGVVFEKGRLKDAANKFHEFGVT